MTTVHCDACGARLVATPEYAGLTVACAVCGAAVRVPGAPPAAADEESAASGGGDLPAPDRDPSAAPTGEVPAPRASGGDQDVTRALWFSAASLVVPLVAPFALWYAMSSASTVRARGGEEPATLRHARFLAVVGCVLLGLSLFCLFPFLLVLG